METEQIDTYTKEQLVEYLEQIDTQKEQLDAAKTVICNRLMEMMEQRQELVGDFIITKVSRKTYKPGIDWARDMGCVVLKEEIDMPRVKKMAQAGVAIPFDETFYLTRKRAENE